MVAFNTVIKPLMPEKIQKMITFNTNFQSLHEFVNKDVLPEELGGNAGKFNNFNLCGAYKINGAIFQESQESRMITLGQNLSETFTLK